MLFLEPVRPVCLGIYSKHSLYSIYSYITYIYQHNVEQYGEYKPAPGALDQQSGPLRLVRLRSVVLWIDSLDLCRESSSALVTTTTKKLKSCPFNQEHLFEGLYRSSIVVQHLITRLQFKTPLNPDMIYFFCSLHLVRHTPTFPGYISFILLPYLCCYTCHTLAHNK